MWASWASCVLRREEKRGQEKKRNEKKGNGKEEILSFMLLPLERERKEGKKEIKIAKITHSVLSRTIVNEAARASPVQPIINMGQGFL